MHYERGLRGARVGWVDVEELCNFEDHKKGKAMLETTAKRDWKVKEGTL